MRPVVASTATKGKFMAGSRPQFDAPLVVGARIEAAVNRPAAAGRIFLVQGERSWAYHEYRDGRASSPRGALSCLSSGLLDRLEESNGSGPYQDW